MTTKGRIPTYSTSGKDITGRVSYDDPSAGARLPSKVNVARGRGPRNFDDGSMLIARGLAGIAADLDSIREDHDRRGRHVAKVQASGYSADLNMMLNSRLAEHSLLRGEEALNLVDNEISWVKEGKEAFIAQGGDDATLRDTLSITYDAISTKYISGVSAIQKTQEAEYEAEVANNMSRSFQSDMATVKVGDVNSLMDISKNMDSALQQYPKTKQVGKALGWAATFLSWARNAPNLTQIAYDAHKAQIVGELGAKGYATLQSVIDQGVATNRTDADWSLKKQKQRKIVEQEKAMHQYLGYYVDGTLTAAMIQDSNLDTDNKRTMLALAKQTSKFTDLSPADRDYSTWVEITEEIRSIVEFDGDPTEVQREILRAMKDKEITKEDGHGFFERIAKRGMYESSVIRDAFNTVKAMRESFLFHNDPRENAMQSIRISNDLNKLIQDTNGDPAEVMKYMNDILMPLTRRNSIDLLFNKREDVPLYKPRQPADMPYIGEEESRIFMDAVNKAYPNDVRIQTPGDLWRISEQNFNTFLELIRHEEYTGN